MQHTMPFSKLIQTQGVSGKAKTERNRLIRKIVVFVVVITLCALFCVWSRVVIVQLGYEVSNLQLKLDELSKHLDHLKIEIERLRSPGRLQKVAEGILNMHAPSGTEIVFVKKEEAGK